MNFTWIIRCPSLMTYFEIFGAKIVTWNPKFKYQYLEICKCDICKKKINLSCSLLFNLLLLWKQTHVSKMICKCICVVILHFESWEYSKEKVVILQWHSNDLKVIYSTHIFPRVYLQGFQFFPWDTYKLNVDEKRAFDSTFDELSTLVKYLYESLL